MYFRQHILDMKPYHPPLSGRWSSGETLLDFNERVLPVHEKVNETMMAWLASGGSWCYPEYDGLSEAIAKYTGAPLESVFFGNGSDQLLDCLFRAVVAPGDQVLLPSPSFAMYKQCAALVESEVSTYSMLSVDPLEEMASELKAKEVRLAVVCQPNNPTGTMLDVAALRSLIELHPKVWFIVDEAYFEFSGQSIYDPLVPLDNLVVTRTFSKAFGLAALRLGYMLASEEMNEQCGKIRGPYDVNRLAAVGALASFEHLDDIQAYAKEVMEECKPAVERAFAELACPAMASQANFLLIREPREGLLEHLQRDGFRVRQMSQPELKGDFRISIGHRAVTDELLSSLSRFSKSF